MYMYQHAMAGIPSGWAAYIYMVVAVPVQWQVHIVHIVHICSPNFSCSAPDFVEVTYMWTL